MHIVFVEPRFPGNQRLFIKALAEIGATVTAIGEGSKSSLDDELKHWLTHYEEVGSVCDEGAVLGALRFIQSRAHVDRFEATVEAHIMPIARVREAAGIPGTSVRTAFLCRDKPAMKEVLREGGVPCAQSTGASTLERWMVLSFSWKPAGFDAVKFTVERTMDAAARYRHPMGSGQAGRRRAAGAADAGISGALRSQPQRSGGRWAG